MKKASRNGFTPEEHEFNDLFIKRHSPGAGPSIIFKDSGYDLDVIGSKRVVNYYNLLQRTYRYHT